LRLLPEYLPGDAVLVLLDPKRTMDRAEEVRTQADEAMQASWATAAEGATAPVEGVAYRPLRRVLDGAGRALVRLGALAAGAPAWGWRWSPRATCTAPGARPASRPACRRRGAAPPTPAARSPSRSCSPATSWSTPCTASAATSAWSTAASAAPSG